MKQFTKNQLDILYDLISTEIEAETEAEKDEHDSERPAYIAQLNEIKKELED